MDTIKSYIEVLQRLTNLSDSAKALLTEAAEFTKPKQLMRLVGDVSHMEFAEPSLDLVRNLDVMARQRVRAHLESAECMWLLARMVEYHTLIKASSLLQILFPHGCRSVKRSFEGLLSQTRFRNIVTRYGRLPAGT